MPDIEAKLREMGLALPEPHPPVGLYMGVKRSEHLVFVSGRVSERRGAVGADVSLADAQIAARDTLLQLLAIAKHDLGGLDDIVSVECLRGFVRSAPDFTDQPRVIDAASALLITLWGENGRHARTATGVAQLPFGAAVQIDMILRIGVPRG